MPLYKKENKLKSRILLWPILLGLMLGCSFDVNDTQIIDIEIHQDNEKNAKLAEDLIYYDPRYIAHKINSYNEQTARGLKLGYFVRSSDGKASYRITYSLKLPAVVSNHETLKAEFEAYIPQLAAFHASKEKLFKKLSPVGEKWANSMLEQSATTILVKSSSLLRDTVTEKKFADFLENISAEYGKRESTVYVRAQYYEAFENIPESVSLYYKQSFSSKKNAMVRISMHQEGGKWLVMGFNVQPHA